MNTNQFAALLVDSSAGPVTDLALRQLAVSVKLYLDNLSSDESGRSLPPEGLRRALRAVEEAALVEADR